MSFPRSEPAKSISDILPTSLVKRRGTARLLLLLLFWRVDDDEEAATALPEIGDDVLRMICRMACERDEFELAAVVPDVRILIPSKDYRAQS